MINGEIINTTEKRQVWHVKLRTQTQETQVDADVRAVQQRIKEFSDKIRSGQVKGHSGKKITTIVAIGIGGSYLGPEFVYEALRYHGASSQGMKLRFLANVDPIDFARALDGVDIEESLFVIVSKTFTTAETMLNARTCRAHIIDSYKKLDAEVDE